MNVPCYSNNEMIVFTEKVKNCFPEQVKKIILFGSRARKDNEELSDYDILIIFDRITPYIREKLIDLTAEMLYEYSAVFSVFPLTEEDLYRKRYSPFIINAQREGIIL